MSVRIDPTKKDRLEQAASANGRSLAYEVETRLDRSFRDDDLRALIRDELRAALADAAERAGETNRFFERMTPRLHFNAGQSEGQPPGALNHAAEQIYRGSGAAYAVDQAGKLRRIA